ncbi:helix-turn-helix domain-containing protein [Pantanalinema sp. GBBB05]|uniref:helix-turn-helix domain-containing protein n=1 Tax=Pantanalinema sp. GBBB05 TaxID=2604139 RepID=UPI001D4C83C5|nr:helix-turn-helix domain-containing protein [Pantanalinema sp. GBBB05]
MSKAELGDRRKTHFWWADNALIDGGHIVKMGLAATVVYIVILRHCDRVNQAFPSLQYLQKKTGLSRQGVVNAVKKLIDLGYIRKVSEGDSRRNSNLYAVCDLELVNSVDQSTQLTSQLSRPQLVNSVDPQLVNSVDPKNTNSEKDKWKKTNLSKSEQKNEAAPTSTNHSSCSSNAEDLAIEGRSEQKSSAAPPANFAARQSDGERFEARMAARTPGTLPDWKEDSTKFHPDIIKAVHRSMPDFYSLDDGSPNAAKITLHLMKLEKDNNVTQLRAYWDSRRTAQTPAAIAVTEPEKPLTPEERERQRQAIASAKRILEQAKGG